MPEVMGLLENSKSSVSELNKLINEKYQAKYAKWQEELKESKGLGKHRYLMNRELGLKK